MDLLLPFTCSASPVKIFYKEKVFFIGSCFSEEIGKKMAEMKFTVCQNPNGIIYDPSGISAALQSYISNKMYVEDDLFYFNELWQSWQHHSSFSGMDKQEVLNNINHSQLNAHEHLRNASWLIITPGTAYQYLLKTSGEEVVNCHKAPSSFFEKKLLPLSKIINDFSSVIAALQKFNPDLKIIFTISPVRHIKDGVIENNLSKARLIEGVHAVKENFENVFYFPAYELVVDVLRDYRFYKNDLVHPSDAAIEFVFEKFCEAFIDPSSLNLMKEIKALHSAMHHKPFNKETLSHKRFQKEQLHKINLLHSIHPYLDFAVEKNFFS